MSKTNPKVDPYFLNLEKWQDEIRLLRTIALSCPLTEELKWDKPFYTFQESNVAVIWGFKAHCALGFCKGALLKDPKGLLVKPGEHTQAVRKIPFTSLDEIVKMKRVLKAYLCEAIDVEKAGLEVAYKETAEFKIPEELQARLDQSSSFKSAFHALTPGRQRGYLLYFGAAKQSATRAARIEKCLPRILKGIGYNERDDR